MVSFGAGEPDFDTPQFIKDAAKTALRRGDTKYTLVPAAARAQGAIAEKLPGRTASTYEPANIIVTFGGKHALYNVVLALLDPGDEVLIPAPYWVSYPEMVSSRTASRCSCRRDEATGFKITPDAAARRRSRRRRRSSILNSPLQPHRRDLHARGAGGASPRWSSRTT